MNQSALRVLAGDHLLDVTIELVGAGRRADGENRTGAGRNRRATGNRPDTQGIEHHADRPFLADVLRKTRLNRLLRAHVAGQRLLQMRREMGIEIENGAGCENVGRRAIVLRQR